MSSPLPLALFLSHGGGPCFFMEDDSGMFAGMSKNSASAKWYRSFARAWPKPRAIVVFSAHWEESGVQVITSASPPLLYDYYGFPDAMYKLQYPAPGDPQLAQEIIGLLGGAGIRATPNSSRGFDHGVFIPLKLMYPDADVPIVQVSLLKNMDPAAHAAVGAALAPLTAPDRGILLVGSGQASHNLRKLRTLNPSEPLDAVDPALAKFLEWLGETVETNTLTEAERKRRLDNWAAAPCAREMHPREEHLLPLHIVEAAVGYKPGKLLYDATLLGSMSLRSYAFPAAAAAGAATS